MGKITLGRVRHGVQLVSLVLLVWGSHLVGYYMADKLSHALPALACAYNQQTGAYCVLVPFQHQVNHRIGGGLAATQGLTWEMVLPTLLTFGSFFILFFVLNKAFCGWICPLGTIQAWLAILGRRLRVGIRRLHDRGLQLMRPWKWVLLGGLVFMLPLLVGLGFLPSALGNSFCQICPSRMATTLLSGSAEHMAVPHAAWLDYSLAALRNFFFGFIVIAALSIRLPFCRICPMLALHASLRRLSPFRLVKVANQRCQRCGICAKACPMDIPEISQKHGAQAFHADCILCGRCAEFCPDDGVISLRWGPFNLFSSQKEYARSRLRSEKPDGRKNQPGVGQGAVVKADV